MTLGQHRAEIVRAITASVAGLASWWGHSCGVSKESVLGEVNCSYLKQKCRTLLL